MNDQINNDCCYLCDTYLTSIPNRVQIEPNGNEVDRISTVKKYLPKINKWQYDLICESCLNYISDFDEIRRKWENNESLFKQKSQDRSKGLSDISNSKKKKFTYICRLCLKAINAQEVTFVYHDDQVYESSYVHKMLSLHSPHTDLSLTENPVICNECLNEVQTFDAFYQMWMEVEDSKMQCSDRNVNSCNDDVEVQLRNSDDNKERRTRCNLTEEESIGSTLSNAEDLLSDRLEFSNGLSTGKSSNDDIFLISDDEDIENQITNSAKIGVDTFTEAESAVRCLLNNEDSVSGAREEIQNDVCCVSDDEDIIEQSLDINQNSRPISRDHDSAQIIPVKENVPLGISNANVGETVLSESDGLFYRNECDALHASLEVEANSDINDLCRIRLWTSNEGNFLIPNKEFLLENISGSSMPVQEELAFVEIDDSDSLDSDDCEEIRTPLLPKISNVCSIDENVISMNETKIEDEKSHQHFASNTDFSNESAAIITPSIEINMTKVKELFQSSPGGAIVVLDDENEFKISQDVPPLEINMSKVKEVLQGAGDKESNLEENLSDFLKFNKTTKLKRNIDTSNELLDFEHQLELDNAHVKQFKVDENATSLPKDKYNFMSVFEDFVVTKGKELDQSSSSKRPSKNSAGTSDFMVSEEDNFECYCKWYPYKQRFSNKSKSRKKIKAIVMENALGSQIYQCNKCLLSVHKECDLLSHNCIKSKAKERFSCTRRRCHFSSQEEENFLLHSIFHNVEDLGWLKCTICEFHSLDGHFMAEHHKQSHQMGIVQKHSKCPSCYFEADDPLILKHHIRRRHRVNKTYKDL